MKVGSEQQMEYSRNDQMDRAQIFWMSNCDYWL